MAKKPIPTKYIIHDILQPQVNPFISRPLDLNTYSKQTLVCKPCMLVHNKMKNTLQIINGHAAYSLCQKFRHIFMNPGHQYLILFHWEMKIKIIYIIC